MYAKQKIMISTQDGTHECLIEFQLLLTKKYCLLVEYPRNNTVGSKKVSVVFIARI